MSGEPVRRDRYFEFDGARLRYRDEGKGPAILLIHGWALDLDMWEPQVSDLSRSFRIIRFDRRGFGRSSGIPGLAADAADARALCGHLGIRRVALVGMSQGARVVQLLASSAAQRLISCVVFDGAPDLRSGARLTAQDMSLTQFSTLVRTDGIEAFRRAWMTHPLARLVTSNPRSRQLLNEIIGRYRASDLLESIRETPNPAAQVPRWPALQANRIPALVLNGRFDLSSRRQAGKVLARMLNLSERVIIDRAGHLPNLDNPAAYNRALRRFFARQARAAIG